MIWWHLSVQSENCYSNRSNLAKRTDHKKKGENRILRSQDIFLKPESSSKLQEEESISLKIWVYICLKKSSLPPHIISLERNHIFNFYFTITEIRVYKHSMVVSLYCLSCRNVTEHHTTFCRITKQSFTVCLHKIYASRRNFF